MNIEELENSIKYYATKYYLGCPEISDSQFDALVDKLRELKPDSYVLKTGWGFEVKGNKIKHKYTHIGSLDKCKSYEEIPDRFKYKKIYISPKLDGLSAVVYYKNGILQKAITRGNGDYGKDITDKLIKIIGPEIPDKEFTGGVRGELIISNCNWNFLLQKYPDQIAPRNFAAGIINRDIIDEDIQYLDFITYKIIGQENKPVKIDRNEILIWLQNNFKHSIPIYYYPQLNKSSWEDYHLKTFDIFKQIGYGLDGLVLTSEDVIFNNATSGYLYDEAAFKFEAESTQTIIKDMEWTLSRTDRLVPVAIVEPITLSGAVITRCTCNNAKMVKDLGLGKGAEVKIIRSGEVIPKIISVVNPSSEDLPIKCPCCNEDLIWEGVDLKCNNPNCSNKQSSDLQQWCEAIGETDGLQWTIMKKYIDNYNIKSIYDLYSKKQIVLDDLLSKHLTITEEKILTFFKKLYLEEVDIVKALVALNIPRLGDKTAILLSTEKIFILNYLQFLSRYLHGSQEDAKVFYDKLLSIVKDATTQSIIENNHKFANLIYLFDNYDINRCRIKFRDNIKNNKKYIAITGSLESMKRKDFEKYIEQFGYELSSSIKKCEYLVNNDITSNSTKNKQAKEFNIPIITEQQFLNLLSKI